MQSSFDFSGQVALVTGGARGIGRAIAKALATGGAEVHSFDWAASDDHESNLPLTTHRVDISDSEAVAAAVGSLPKPATLLVNNAGITRDRSIAKMSDEEWSQVIAVNLTGAFNMIRAVTPAMAEAGGGRIVNITSINGLRGKFGQANYTAAKAGLIGLTKTSARELGRKGITVNAVAPGMVLTEMAEQLPEEFRAQALKENVIGRLATPADIAAGVTFLLSDAAAIITGEVLRIDGGQYI
ncbi:MAG: 3-oxoacyl-ACP reductase FabG [Rhodospirillales bacterium]|nr:3-oxoacyl-ACP reductase FabG [Rhodospirillales bacterium]